ncbi:hypothetical protein EW146_g2630 [Bondarzewia mesenterica]|uniref:Oxidase ustYa n=1 Tax=Bondarzewia mesenterica TaxID=1095465 RepID=A0A4S4M0I0_9AGAM|nr:hypothetical protein EW146_g2630 [Bondarzewia mesenterica]
MNSKESGSILHVALPRSSSQWRSSIVTIMTCVLLVLNLLVFLYQLRVQVLPARKPHYTYVNGDWPRELDMPTPLRTVSMAFNDSTPYMDIYSPEAGPVWDANLPLGRGYIKLGGHEELFGVAMFHQMHCLVRLRAVFAGDKDESGHVKHCFNYLRQAILCNADITLEPGRKVTSIGKDGKKHTEIEGGYDVTHTCRDWRQVWRFMEDEWVHAFPDSDPMAFAAMNGQA